MESAMTAVRGLAMGLDKGKVLVAVRDLADAHAKYRAAWDSHLRNTGRPIRGGTIYEVGGAGAPVPVARISQNGRIWKMDDVTPLYPPVTPPATKEQEV